MRRRDAQYHLDSRHEAVARTLALRPWIDWSQRLRGTERPAPACLARIQTVTRRRIAVYRAHTESPFDPDAYLGRAVTASTGRWGIWYAALAAESLAVLGLAQLIQVIAPHDFIGELRVGLGNRRAQLEQNLPPVLTDWLRTFDSTRVQGRTPKASANMRGLLLPPVPNAPLP